MKAWLVTGESGMYSDWSLWFIVAYADEASARAHAELARQGYAAHLAQCKESWHWKCENANPFDTSGIDTDETSYKVCEIEVRDGEARPLEKKDD